MELEITQMCPQDLEEIQSSLLENFDDFWTPSVLTEELKNKQNLNSHYFVIKQKTSTSAQTNTSLVSTNNVSTCSCMPNSQIVGFAGILTIIDEVNIMNIVVRKDKRNLKIGSSLLEFIINFAKNEHASSITLEVNEHNTPAINLYQKYHFKQVGLRKKYYNNIDNAILMTLLL